MKTLCRMLWIVLNVTALLLASCGLDIGDGHRGDNGSYQDAGQDDARPRRDVGQSDAGYDDVGVEEPGTDDASVGQDPAQPETPGAQDPRILTLSTNSQRLLQGQTLIVSAVVTDPDGINDLIGGVLIDAESGGTYGAFATAESEGAYSIHLAWWDLHQVRPLDTGMGGETRFLRAEFYDVAGHTASGQVSVDLTCESATDALCSGYCRDVLHDRENCGACGNDVSGIQITACVEGVGYGLVTSTIRTSCRVICGADGLVCAPSPHWGCEELAGAGGEAGTGGLEGCAVWACPNGSFVGQTSMSCDDIPPETHIEGDELQYFEVMFCSCATVAP